ncbi:MAG: hypothetical protein LBN01_02395 [Endomicrobium sp.]|nr:hypothetical protein [Endomicrobium sp.]
MPLEDNPYIIQAYESISDVNSKLNIKMPEGNYNTVNGWILELFGRIPKAGEKIDWQNYSVEIKDADLKKVNRIVLRVRS